VRKCQLALPVSCCILLCEKQNICRSKGTSETIKFTGSPLKKDEGFYVKQVIYFLVAFMLSTLHAPAAAAAPPSGSQERGGVQADRKPVCGRTCTEDSQCVIVGGSHMLVWNSPSPAGLVVVCIHGLGFCARAYKGLAEKLSEAGIDGYGVNVRGFGPDRNDRQHAKLDCLETAKDVGELLRGIRKAEPGKRIILVGESMGGAIALRIAAESPDLIDGVVSSAPAWKILRLKKTAVKGVLEIVLSPHKPGPASRSVMRQATDDPELRNHLLSDPSHKLKLSLAEANSFLRYISSTDAYARKLTRPALIIQGLQDKLVSPEAVAMLFNDIHTSDKQFLIDAQGEHLLLEESGFSKALLDRLLIWLKSTPAAGQRGSVVEVVNKDNLSVEAKKHLARLLALSEGKSKGKSR
jgi:acylglycerol lipase